MNASVSALRFFFKVTLGLQGYGERLATVRKEDRLPQVLSPEEVALLHCAPSLKHKAALSVAHGCGLRVSEITHLKVGDIDSARMLIRVEQGKGRKDRYVMLAPDLLELLRRWWRSAKPKGWLFPGRDPGQPRPALALHPAAGQHVGRFTASIATAETLSAAASTAATTAIAID